MSLVTFIKMAQFDSIIIFPLLWSLLLTLFLHYNILLKTVIPNFFGANKYRTKKLESVFSSYKNLGNLSHYLPI
jgi:hypothetical protein